MKHIVKALLTGAFDLPRTLICISLFESVRHRKEANNYSIHLDIFLAKAQNKPKYQCSHGIPWDV
jgi:hypothetical protein